MHQLHSQLNCNGVESSKIGEKIGFQWKNHICRDEDLGDSLNFTSVLENVSFMWLTFDLCSFGDLCMTRLLQLNELKYSLEEELKCAESHLAWWDLDLSSP